MANIEDKVNEIIKPIITKLGYMLYDVVYEKEGKEYYLRVFIDGKKGISLDDCELVSNAITDKLDEIDIIKDMYFLEVSSCGLERVLRKDEHFQSQLGNQIELKLYKPLNGQKQHNGILKKFNDNIITVEIDKNDFEIQRKDIAQVKTLYNWE